MPPPFLPRIKQLSDAEVRYAQLVGLVTMAWNDLHGTYLAVFSVLLHDDPAEVMMTLGMNALEPGNLGAEIWHCLASDDAKRSILARAVTIKLPEKSRIRQNLLWAIEKTGKLSTYRNDAAHVAVWDQGRPSRPNVAPDLLTLPPKRLKRFSAVKLRVLLRALSSDLFELREYVWWQFLSLSPVMAGRLPTLRRPILRSVRLIERHPSKRERPKRRSANRSSPPNTGE